MATYTVGSGKDYATINLGIQACNNNPLSLGARDTLVIDPGTFNESLDMRATVGGWLIPCILTAADPDNKPVITSTGAAQAVRADSVYRGTAVGQFEFHDLVISGWTAATNGVVNMPVEGIVVERCEFIGNTGRRVLRWVGGTAAREGRVEQSLFHTSGSTGSGEQGMILTWTLFADVFNNVGICPTNVQFQHDAYTGPRYTMHNSVYGTWNTGGNCKVIKGVGTSRANVIQNAGTGGANAIDATGGTYTENLAFGAFTANFAGTDGGGNDTGLDPQFTNPGAYDLTTPDSSPCFRTVARSALVLNTYDGAVRSDPTDKGAFETLATTTVGSVTVISSTSIKLNLVDSVTSDATWEDEANFTITPSGGAIAVTVTLATITDAGMSITLTTTEHTNNGAYDVAWAGVTNIVDGTDGYTGTSTPPVVSSATMTAGKVIRVTFSKSMTNNAALTTVGNYLISGMTVSGVARVDATRVDVTMTERIPAASSTISVNGPQDLVLNPVSNSTANFAVPYLTFVPGGTATNENRTVAVAFNIPATGGVDETSDWTFTKTSIKGADVTVTGVAIVGANVTLTVHPGLTRGVSYTVAAPNAIAGTGPIG